MRQRGMSNELTATEIVRLMSSGKATAEAIVRACLERIGEREQDVRAWTYLDPDRAIAQAREVDRRAEQGALRGVPVAVKDIIATDDMPTAYGSPIYAGHRPPWDAACVTAIRAAGGIVLGKTVTTEFASSHPGKTVHPYDPTRTPGGSSSGSAAAVADGMAPLAIGTQTGGSVIRPASFCGVVGYKPSFGWVDRHGVKPLSESLDTVGGMGRTVADAARLVSVMAGRPALLDLSEVHRPRIAVWRSEALRQAEPDMLACLENAAMRLSNQGARVSDFTPPAIFSDLDAAHHEIEYFEMGKALAFEMRTYREQLSAALRKRIEAGQACPPELYDEKRLVAREGRIALLSVFADFDVILTPSAAGEAPKGLTSTGNALFNRIWTLLYGPAVTISAGLGGHGMPLGVQFIGPRNDDLRTLAIAQWAEEILRH
jgi:Asp-tRNA(Asn)/Glu-tRNA(Gln) amidotransferase A subunit family amidase